MKLEHYKNNIYYIKPNKKKSSKYKYIGSKRLNRLLDFIYLPVNTDKLTKEQIISINELRYKYKNKDELYSLNNKMKLFFADIIKCLQINSLLDFGCGYDPIINYLDNKVNFVAYDIDRKVIHLLEDSMLVTDNLYTLRKENFDLIISIFVFHFNITLVDIKNLYSLLTKNGILIMNVYNRDTSSREDLYLLLNDEGFKIEQLSLFSKKNHELWIVSKNNLNQSILNDIIKISKLYW
jgi:SAM-dependent methyltransferase